MAINTCVVSGTLKSADNVALSGVGIYAYVSKPFFHKDGTQIVDYKVSTTSASDGTWSLTLIETTTVNNFITIEIDFPSGSVTRMKRTYTITVPNSASADFSTLAAGQ